MKLKKSTLKGTALEVYGCLKPRYTKKMAKLGSWGATGLAIEGIRLKNCK